jgi:GNAT superfamily N-acetyltransferase
MAVDDRLHGHGLGTLLLERLALLAVRHGFTRLWAITHADNVAMREVFASSGLSMDPSGVNGSPPRLRSSPSSILRPSP